jgi:hypothetical protein
MRNHSSPRIIPLSIPAALSVAKALAPSCRGAVEPAPACVEDAAPQKPSVY